MNRRNFFKALAVAPVVAIGGAVVVNRVTAPESEVRRVMFAPPGEPVAIYWMAGHMPPARFVRMYELGEITIPIEQVGHGWASRKLSGVSICLSDAPLENFEPITYWIRADHAPAPFYRWEIEGELVALDPLPLSEQEIAAIVDRRLTRAIEDIA